MADMLQSAIQWLSNQLKANASQTVVYTRGYDAVTVQAVYGQKLLHLDDGDGGIKLEWVDMDFLIAHADLNFGGEPIWPERGDLIYAQVGPNGTEQLFEVSPYGTDAPWRWSDPYQTRFRIHTKQISWRA